MTLTVVGDERVAHDDDCQPLLGIAGLVSEGACAAGSGTDGGGQEQQNPAEMEHGSDADGVGQQSLSIALGRELGLP
ncbi:hypothetical protein [Modestobacter italicus]|uniref:hypothetical protein n=1 Tax=Modestobacter italicus (strain DSM 44449 / CECT 9708 / BC 501) TaxID=2732864 RepID=UPI0006876A0C|nr:hypothetical protein [Modestobacter marinus]